MAIALVANRGNSNFTSAVGANSMPILNPASITPGNTLFLSVYAKTQAAGLLPAVACGAVVTDPRGNTWVAETCQSSNDGVNGRGGLLMVYRSLNIVQYQVGDALSIVGSIASLLVEFQIFEFSGVSQGPHAIYTAANQGTSTTTSTALPVTVSAAGQLVLAVGGVGSDNTVVTDTDTLDGSWTAAFRRTPGSVNFQMWESHKILTGFTSSPQSYIATWTSSGGDNTWAQMLLVYDPINPGGTAIAQLFPPQDNPNYGCLAGSEPMPTGSALVPVDTGTAYQIEHTLPTYSFGTHFYSAVVQYDDTEPAIQQHHIAYDLYQKGAEVPQDVVTQLSFPISKVNTLTTGVTVYNSAGTLQETGPVTNSANALRALQNAGDYYLRFNTATAGASIQCQFDLTGGSYNINNYANSRIIRVGVRFVGWKDDSSTLAIPVGEGLEVIYQPSMGSPTSSYEVEMGAWLTPDYKRSAIQQLRWLGETNPLPKIANSNSYYGGGIGNGTWFRTFPDAGTSFSFADILAFNTAGTDFLKLYGLAGADFSQTLVFLDFLELVVEVAPERRLGNVVQTVSTSPIYAVAPLPASQYSPGRASIVTLRSVLDQSVPLTVTGSPNDYALVAREALPGSTGDYWTALTTAPGAPAVGGVIPSSFAGLQIYTPAEALGPSLQYIGYTQPRPMSPNQRPLTKRVVVDGVFANDAETMEQYSLSFGALDIGNYLTAGSFFPVYQSMAPLSYRQVYTAHSQQQKFYDAVGSTYDYFRVVCKPDPLTAVGQPLVLTITGVGGATTSITPAQALAGEAVGNGWYAVMAPITTPFAGGGVVRTLTFTSTATATNAWQVSSVEPIGQSFPLTFEPQAGVSTSSPVTYAAILECTLTAPSVTLGTSTITITPPNHNACLATTTAVPTITINNGALYDRVIIERGTLAGTNYTVTARLVDPVNGAVVTDYEAPWDSPQFDASLAVYYRVTGYRDSDRRSVSTISGPWAGTSVAPGAAFGLGSNELGAIVIYTPQDQSTLRLTWSALNPVQMIPLHMQDFQYALRIPENRGLSVSVDVEMSQFQACLITTSSGYATYLAEMLANYGEKIGSGRFAMTPRPYESSLLPIFNSIYGWTLKLPGGHTRRVTLQVGDMSITTINGLYAASLNLTDVIPLSADPYSEV